ncbi:MAG TPA: helix-hairpin-helix domain-containing protein [Gemmatimonadaceae bacterium]|nr:helix-hairpin-helix domain-containing protein [Gemmatimonadaceae bacterium]
MPTPGERKALGFLVFLVLSGSTVRLWRSRHPDPPPADGAALSAQLRRVDSAASAKRGRSRAKGPTTKSGSGPAPAGPVDLDRAMAAEIEALPGIGQALAARIVAHRDSVGSFGSMDAFCEVRGIGPSTARRLSPLVTFSAPRRSVTSTCDEGSKSSRKPRKPRTPELR